jgi:hypothetical protein
MWLSAYTACAFNGLISVYGLTLVAVRRGAIRGGEQAGSGSGDASHSSRQNNGRNSRQGKLLELRNFDHRN